MDSRKRFISPRVMREINRFRQQSRQTGLLNVDPLLTQTVFELNMADEEENPEWTNFLRYLYAWQSAGISEIIFQSGFMSETWSNMSKTGYSYTGGNLTEVDFSTWVGGSEWMVAENQEFTYTMIGGQLYLSEITFSESGELLSRSVITYDGTDITKVEEFMVSGDEELLYMIIEFEYDGTDLSLTYIFTEDDFFEIEGRTIFLDTSPSEFYELVINEQQFVPIPSQALSFVQLNLPSTVDQFWDGNEFVNEYRDIRTLLDEPTEDYFYAVTYTFESYFDGEWEPMDKLKIAFDENDNILFGAFYEYDFFDDEWLLYDKEIMIYDESGTVPVMVMMTEFDPWLGDDFFYEYGRLTLTWDFTGVNIGNDATQHPTEISLGNAYPNPFNPSTNIPFEIAQSGHVSLEVFDLLGRKVATLVNEARPAGSYTARFDAGALSSGIYLVRLQSGDMMKTSRVTLIK